MKARERTLEAIDMQVGAVRCDSSALVNYEAISKAIDAEVAEAVGSIDTVERVSCVRSKGHGGHHSGHNERVSVDWPSACAPAAARGAMRPTRPTVGGADFEMFNEAPDEAPTPPGEATASPTNVSEEVAKEIRHFEWCVSSNIGQQRARADLEAAIAEAVEHGKDPLRELHTNAVNRAETLASKLAATAIERDEARRERSKAELHGAAWQRKAEELKVVMARNLAIALDEEHYGQRITIPSGRSLERAARLLAGCVEATGDAALKGQAQEWTREELAEAIFRYDNHPCSWNDFVEQEREVYRAYADLALSRPLPTATAPAIDVAKLADALMVEFNYDGITAHAAKEAAQRIADRLKGAVNGR